MSRYINPYTDFWGKKLFGEEASNDLLAGFLNALLPERHQILSLEFHNPGLFGSTSVDRRVVFDIHCKNDKKEPFIGEMQKAEQATSKTGHGPMYRVRFVHREKKEKYGTLFSKPFTLLRFSTSSSIGMVLTRS